MNISALVGGKRPTSTITLTPVANGWVVMLPEEIQAPDFNKVLRGIAKSVHDDDGNLPTPIEHEPDPHAELEINRDQSMHIFPDIDAALSFLKYKIPSDKGKLNHN
jgi:hypothetical protein